MHKGPAHLALLTGPGFRLRREVSRPADDVVQALSRYPLPLISDSMNRMYGMVPDIKLITDSARKLCGPACTVRVYPGDNLLVHKAVDLLMPGDVLVVDAGGFAGAATLGEFVVAKGQKRGMAGVVVDGFVRDVGALQRSGLPIFARGITQRGPLHRGPGEVNFPAQCGGIVVMPGDIIVGDENGVVVVPHCEAPLICLRLPELSRMEAQYRVKMHTDDRSTWADEILADLGFDFIDQR